MLGLACGPLGKWLRATGGPRATGWEPLWVTPSVGLAIDVKMMHLILKTSTYHCCLFHKLFILSDPSMTAVTTAKWLAALNPNMIDRSFQGNEIFAEVFVRNSYNFVFYERYRMLNFPYWFVQAGKLYILYVYLFNSKACIKILLWLYLRLVKCLLAIKLGRPLKMIR